MKANLIPRPCIESGNNRFNLRLILIISIITYCNIIAKTQIEIIPQCGFAEQTIFEQGLESQPSVACQSSLGANTDFIPLPTDPIKYIDVAINVMQKESPGGPDNFSNIQSHRDYLLDIFNNACNLHVFQTNDDPMYDGSVHLDPNHVPDVKLRLNVIEINFIYDNRGWNNDGSISGHYNYTTNPRKNDAALNIFICEGLTVIDQTTGQIKLWGLGGIGNSQYVMMNGMHKVYQTGNAPSWSNLWMQMGELLAHEVGHTLGLSHSWASCSSPQFDDIDPCPHSNLWCYPLSPTPIGQPPCLNNCMGYSALRRWFSPKQIGAMHRNLTNRDISRFVRHEIVINNNIVVTSDQTWTVNRYVFGDIVVKPGYTLTINSKVFLPIAGKIIVERGARLNLECAYLTTCRAPLNSLQIQTEGDYWSGIKVWGNTALPHLSGMSDPTTPLQPNYAGRLISNTSKIHNAREAIALFNTTEPWPNSQYYYGGFVYANETEFKNNRRSAAFMKYDFDNFSLFQKCQFISDNNDTRYGITLWGSKRLYIFDCDFTNISKVGVLGWDSKFEAALCHFNNVHHGMESYSSHPLTGVMVSSNNDFTECEVGSQGTNSLSCYISENTYTDNYFGSAHIGDSRFLILNNIFQNCANGVNVMMTQNNGNNQIRCNTFTENETGILALGNNAGTLFAFNNLSNSTTNGDNARVTFYAGETIVVPGEIRYAQAWVDPNNPSNLLAAGNLFSSNFSSSREHITTVPASQNSNASMEFIYHHPDPTSEPRVYPFCGIGGTCPSGSTFKFSYFLNEGPFTNECRRSLAGYCLNEDCYDEILAYYSSAKQNYITTPTPTNKELYQVARAFKYNSLDTIIRDHLTRGDYSGLDIILQADDETFAKRARIGLKILEANFTGARLLLSNYPIIEPGDQDFVSIQTINIDRLETKTGLSSQQILDLQVFIDSKSIEKGYARAILSHELDSIYEPEIGDAEITPRSIFESDSEIKVERFSVIPNPTSGLIDIFPNVPIDDDLEYSVFVHGIDGRYILQNIQKGNKIQLDLSGYDSGIYILSILSSDKSIIFTTKIVLAK